MLFQQRAPGSLAMNGPAGHRDMLAADADREAVAGLLSTAFADGRLTAAEHAERAGAAYAARTHGELGVLTADLPAPAGASVERSAAVIPGEADRCLPCALLICCPPAGIAWLLAARRRSRACRGAGG